MSSLSLIDHFKRTIELSQEEEEELQKLKKEDVIFHDKFNGLELEKSLKDKLLGAVIELRKQHYESQAKVFQDSIHGPMRLHPLLVKIIDTPQFQRLRNIKQLGGVYHVYPAASHNRFEHSLGVCHIAGKLVEELQRRQPELNIDERDILCVKIAALCHDMGHGPYSHLFQDQFIRNHVVDWKHEKASVKLLCYLVEQNEQVKEEFKHCGLCWDESVPHNDKVFVEELIHGISMDQLKDNNFRGRPNEKSFLYQIVANKLNGMDTDRMDYVKRDGVGLGISTSFDWSRYVEFVRVIDVDIGAESKVPCICPRDKMIPDLQELLHTRHRLHRMAYQHKTKRAIECMIAAALERAKSCKLLPGDGGSTKNIIEAVDDMIAFTALTDSILDTIRSSISSDLEEARDLFKRVDTRDIYMFVHMEIVPTLHSKSSESILEEIAEYATQYLHTHHRYQQITKEDVKVIGNVYNYGMDDKNPFERLWCYHKSSPNQASKYDINKDSALRYPFPDKFEEADYMVYCTTKMHPDVLEAIKEGFKHVILNESN